MSNPAGRVAGKVVVVAGGASGIGRAAADLLAREGASVAIADSNLQGATAVAESINATGTRASAHQFDAASEADWDALFSASATSLGAAVDVLVNSAGVGSGYSIVDMPLEHWRHVMSVNLDGAFLGTRAAIRAMRQAGKAGSIVNLGSVLGFKAAAGASAYCACKAGLMSLSRAAALECAAQSDGIRVNCVAPGLVDTPMWDRGPLMQNLMQKMGGRAPVIQMLAQRVPFKHMAQPQDVAQAILFLASDESRYVTGTELIIDGGMRA